MQRLMSHAYHRKLCTSDILARVAIDYKEFKNHAVDYVNMFFYIYDLEDAGYETLYEVPKFYIKDLQMELKKLSKKDREVLEKFFGLTGARHYLKQPNPKNVALTNMQDAAAMAAAKLRTVDQMYRFNKRFHQVIDQIAQKVYDPEGKYTNVQKAKLAHLYFNWVKDFQYMFYDSELQVVGKTMTEEDQRAESRVYLASGYYVKEWEYFFSKIPDNDIIAAQIAEFVWQSDADADEMMMRFSELTDDDGIKGKHEDLNGETCMVNCLKMRETKERMFSAGEWNSDYMRLSKFAEMPVEMVQGLLEWYKKYRNVLDYDAEKCGSYIERRVFMRTKGEVIAKSAKLNDHFNYVDDFEVIFFLDLLYFIQRYMPEMEFHGKPFQSYGFLGMIA